MISTDNSETWKQIPPEEKIEMLSRSHATGILTCFIAIIIGSTLAIALQIDTIMWASIIFSPILFQFAAGKAWRDLKPRAMLEYLAARSAARRFAFANHSKDLTLNLIFRGKVTESFEQEKILEELEATITNTKEAEVWIALFNDAVVLMQEEPGGARVKLAQLINEKLEIETNGGDQKGSYTNSKEINISYKDRGVKRKCKITSRFPAALVVFEKRLLQLQNEFKKAQDRALRAATIDAGSDDDETSTGLLD